MHGRAKSKESDELDDIQHEGIGTGSRGMSYEPIVFPFTAIVGQENLKKALILNAINPSLKGVLVRGEKGTAKSTAVRALAALLPEIEVVDGCAMSCDPGFKAALCRECLKKLDAGISLPRKKHKRKVLTLPVNATEDSLVGSIDFEHALKHGKKRFHTGLLAAVNRGILYIDEVNLLDDHLVDLLLDVSASGVNLVEREGVGYSHPSKFILIGTMNPEEGDLRPQLMDRFGLAVAIKGSNKPEDRMEIIRRREEFDTCPETFGKTCRDEEDAQRLQITNAIRNLEKVVISDIMIGYIAEIAEANNVAGHRADLIIEAAAKTLAAYRAEFEVNDGHIREAAELALLHRTRAGKVEMPEFDESRIRDKLKPFNSTLQNTLRDAEPQEFGEAPEDDGLADSPDAKAVKEKKGVRLKEAKGDQIDSKGRMMGTIPQNELNDEIHEVGQPVSIDTKDLKHERDRLMRKASGRRNRTRTSRKTGRYVRSTAQRKTNDLAFDATLRAAAPMQLKRDKKGMAVCIEPEDIREKIRERKTSTLMVFVVDASGSMGTRLMSETKGAIMFLLLEAYQKRDHVGMVAFKGQGAEVLLPPTDSIELAKCKLEELPTGGKTPVAHGLVEGYELIKNSLRKDPNTMPVMVVITDGRANVGMIKGKNYEGTQHHKLYEELYKIAEMIRSEKNLKSLVIDAEEKRLGSFGRAKKLAQAMGAKYLVLEEIRSGKIADAIKDELGR